MCESRLPCRVLSGLGRKTREVWIPIWFSHWRTLSHKLSNAQPWMQWCENEALPETVPSQPWPETQHKKLNVPLFFSLPHQDCKLNCSETSSSAPPSISAGHQTAFISSNEGISLVSLSKRCQSLSLFKALSQGEKKRREGWEKKEKMLSSTCMGFSSIATVCRPKEMRCFLVWFWRWNVIYYIQDLHCDMRNLQTFLRTNHIMLRHYSTVYMPSNLQELLMAKWKMFYMQDKTVFIYLNCIHTIKLLEQFLSIQWKSMQSKTLCGQK